jgi:hypothetical protein
MEQETNRAVVTDPVCKGPGNGPICARRSALAERHPRLWRAAVLTALALLGWLLYMPWTPLMPDSSLEASWRMTLNHAFLTEMSFGREIIFTYGPYGFLTANLYDPGTYGLMIVGNGLMVVAVALCLEKLLWERAPRRCWAVLTILAALAFGFYLDILLVIAFIVYWQAVRKQIPGIADGVIIPAIALAALTKFTIFILVAGCATAMALDDVLRRRFPWRSAGIAVSVLLLWLAARQPLPGLWDFLTSSMEVSRGYTEAMPVELIPKWHVLAGATSILCIVAALLVATWQRRRLESLLHVAVISAVMFMLFKHAFVRHDEHELILLCHLPLVTAAYIFLLRSSPSSRVVCALLMASLAFPLIITMDGTPNFYGKSFRLYRKVEFLDKQHAARQAVTRRWWINLRDRHEQSIEKLRSADPLLPTDNPVDIYSFRQYPVLAHGMDYRPRPVFQSYSAYTPALARANADHLLGPGAPKTIFFASEPRWTIAWDQWTTAFPGC